VNEIAKRAVACKGWRWMPGAVSLPDTQGRTWRRTGDGWAQESGKRLRCRVDKASLVPDLTDPATLGCLRHQAEEAHGAWDIMIQVDIQPRMEGAHGWWRAVDSRGRKIQGASFICPNDADLKVFALISALEAAG